MLLLLLCLFTIYYNQAAQATSNKAPLSELMHKSIHEIDTLLKDFQREIRKEKSVLRAVDREIQDVGLPDYSMTPGSDHTGNHTPATFVPYPAGYFTTTTKDPWESWNLPGLQYSTAVPSQHVPTPGHLPDLSYPRNHTPFNTFPTFDRTMPHYGPTNMNYSAHFARPSFPFTVPSRAEPSSAKPHKDRPSGSPSFRLPPRERVRRPGFMRSVTARLKARTSPGFFAVSSVRIKAMRNRSWHRLRGRPTKANRMTAPTARRPQQRKRTLSKAQAWVRNRQWMKTKKPGRIIQEHMREGEGDPPPEPKPVADKNPPPEPNPVAVDEPAAGPNPVGVNEPAAGPNPVGVDEPAAGPNPVGVDEPAAGPNPVGVDEPAAGPNPVGVDEPAAGPNPVGVDDPPPEPKPIVGGNPVTDPTTPLVTISIPELTDILPSMSLPGLDEVSLITEVPVSETPSTTKNPFTAEMTSTQTAFTAELFQQDEAGFLFVTSPATIYVPVTERTTNTFGQVLYNADNFTVTTPDAAPYRAYYELMESLDEGYLTVYLLELTRLVAQKAPRDAGAVLAHAEIIYNKLYERGSVAFFGEEILELGTKVSRMFSGSSIDILQSHANMMNQMLAGRAQYISVEVNSIIDYADMLFEDDEGEGLFEAVRMFEVYPSGGVSSYEVCLNLIESFIRPYRRLRNSNRLRTLIDSVMKVAATRFGRRRSGHTATTTEPNKTTNKEKPNPRSLRQQIEIKRQRIKRPAPGRGDQYKHRRQVYDAAPPVLRSMLPITKHQKRFRVMTPKQLRTNGYMSMVRPTVAYFRRRLGRPRHPDNGVLQLFPQVRDVQFRRQPADEEPRHLEESAPQPTLGAMRDEVRRIVEESSYSDEEAALKLHLRQALRVNWHRTSTPSLQTAGA